MTVWLYRMISIRFLVDLLLILTANRITGHAFGWKRALVAAALGGLYAGACLMPGFSFLGGFLWRMVILLSVSLVAFGMQPATLRRGAVFLLLSLALGGVATELTHRGLLCFALGAAVVFLLCRVGLFSSPGKGRLLPVELRYGEKQVKLTALWDTGNTLQDPVSGGNVLVLALDPAVKLTGLTREQLKQPVESITAIPGLRLIPYRSLGNPNGMLLALKIPQMQIGTWKGSGLVALSPDRFSPENAYQALAGGNLG